MKKTDPRQFGRRKPCIDRDRERTIAAKVAILCIAGAVISFVTGFFLDDPKGGSAFAYIVGFGLLIVALAAAGEAFGFDPDEEA